MYHGGLISLYLQVLVLAAGASHAEGPYEPLVATLGGEVELPCSLWPPQNIENMQISWTRSLPSQVVHLYEDGKDKPEEAMEEYLGRTELVRNVMDKGTVTLKIFNVQLSDSGSYRCAFQHGSFHTNTMMELKVEVAESTNTTLIIIVVSALATFLILLLIFIGLYVNRNKLKNSISCHMCDQHTNPAVQPTYARVPADATTDASDATSPASTDAETAGAETTSLASPDAETTGAETTSLAPADPETAGSETTSLASADAETTGAETTSLAPADPETAGSETTSLAPADPETAGSETTSLAPADPETAGSETTSLAPADPETTGTETTSSACASIGVVRKMVMELDSIMHNKASQ